MSMAQTFPAASITAYALMLGSVAMMIAARYWRGTRLLWPAANLTAALLQAGALALTAAAAAQVGWSPIQYAAVFAQTVTAGLAVWAALVGRGPDGQTPPGRREPLPQDSGKVILLRTRRDPGADKAA